ncbi:CD109-like protein, partial [Mya arenaria]
MRLEPVLALYIAVLSGVCAQHSSRKNRGQTQDVSWGTYVVFFHTNFHLNEPFEIFFRQLGDHYNTVEAKLISERWEDGKEINKTVATASIFLTPSKMEGTISLKLSEAAMDGSDYRYHGYYLDLKGSGKQLFENSTRVGIAYRDEPLLDEHIFVQTDKRMYKTRQKVLYRVFVLDKEMKPVDSPLDIEIFDDKNNKIKEDIGVRGLFGVSGELQLSDAPSLGAWGIKATKKYEDNETISTMGKFFVSEYVLPKYDVQLKLPDYGTVDGRELKGTVIAKYTYGKPVKGRVVLTVKNNNNYWKQEHFAPKAVQTQFEINGEAEFSIPMDTLLKFDPDLKQHSLGVEANVTEEETGESRVAFSQVNFVKEPISISFADGRTYFHENTAFFRPGFPFTTYVKVSLPDGRPLAVSGERLRVTVTYFTYNASSSYRRTVAPKTPTSQLMTFLSPYPGGQVIFMPEQFLTVPGNGVVKINLNIPSDVASGHIEALVKTKKASLNLSTFKTKSDAYINLEMKTGYVKVGDQAEFILTSNVRPSEKITYHTHYTNIYSANTQISFFVKMTVDMAPRSKIVAYYYNRDSDEFINDGLEFAVEMNFKNDMSLRFDRSQVAPGSNVTLSARADPNSQIFLCAVDKSVLLMDQENNNQITQRRIQEELGLHQLKPNIYNNAYLYSKLGGYDPGDLFYHADLLFMSDVRVYNFHLSL